MARLEPLEKRADTLLKHAEGIANYWRTKVRFGVVEADANIRLLINRGGGHKNLRYLLLKAKRMCSHFSVCRKLRKKESRPGSYRPLAIDTAAKDTVRTMLRASSSKGALQGLTHVIRPPRGNP